MLCVIYECENQDRARGHRKDAVHKVVARVTVSLSSGRRSRREGTYASNLDIKKSQIKKEMKKSYN